MDYQTTRKLNIIFFGILPVISIIFIGYFGQDTRDPATLRTVTIEGIKEYNNSTIYESPTPSFEYNPILIRSGSIYHLTYIAHDKSSYNVELTTSPDGYKWTEPEACVSSSSNILQAIPVLNIGDMAVAYTIETSQLTSSAYISRYLDGAWHSYEIGAGDNISGYTVRYNLSGQLNISGQNYIALQKTMLNTTDFTTTNELVFLSLPDLDDNFSVPLPDGDDYWVTNTPSGDAAIINSRGLNISSDLVMWRFIPYNFSSPIRGAWTNDIGMCIYTGTSQYVMIGSNITELPAFASTINWHSRTYEVTSGTTLPGTDSIAAVSVKSDDGGDIWVFHSITNSGVPFSKVKISSDNTYYYDISVLMRSGKPYIIYTSDRWGNRDIYGLLPGAAMPIRITQTTGNESAVHLSIDESGIFVIDATYTTEGIETSVRYLSHDFTNWSYDKKRSSPGIEYIQGNNFRDSKKQVLVVLSAGRVYYSLNEGRDWEFIQLNNASSAVLVNEGSETFDVYYSTADGITMSRFKLNYVMHEDIREMEHLNNMQLGLKMSVLLLILIVLYGFVVELGKN